MDLYVTFLLELKESIGKQIGMTKKKHTILLILEIIMKNTYMESFLFDFLLFLGFFCFVCLHIFPFLLCFLN